MGPACPHCACTSEAGATAHALLALLADDDLDAAIERGLLEHVDCPGCNAGCNARLAETRDRRCGALAARARHRNRAQRLAQRQAARGAARAPSPAAAETLQALPPAAADALARALAKAGRRTPS